MTYKDWEAAAAFKETVQTAKSGRVDAKVLCGSSRPWWITPGLGCWVLGQVLQCNRTLLRGGCS
jgi:hypothetical protein